MNIKHGLLAFGLAILPLPSYAHTPYIAPMSFDVGNASTASFDASFAETFFIPEAAFDKSEFVITTPDKQQSSPTKIAYFKSRTVLEQDLKLEGTYKISTGIRRGATFLIYDLDGKEHRKMNPTGPAPKGAKVKNHFQSVTRADTYISRKEPSNAALIPENIGLEIIPLSNPNEVFQGENFYLQILMAGNKLDKAITLSLYHANTGDKAEAIKIDTDAKGKATLNIKDAGIYLLRARFRDQGATDENQKGLSYTTTLSFQVFDNI